VLKRFLSLFFFIVLGFSTPAAAYIDPNTGGQIYQALYPVLAVLLGVLTFARQWVAAIWHRFATVMRSLFSRE
jgi:hypothetical protein